MTISATSLYSYLPLLGLATLFCWPVLVVFYRLWFHPLAHIPGPKLAAATWLYQTYYGLAGGRSVFYAKVAELHKKYGPVVRITPDEIHLSDPENYDRIYSMTTKYWKSPRYYASFGMRYATFATLRNETHSVRRAALNPFFSRKMVLQLEDAVQDKVRKLMDRASAAFGQGKALDVHYGFRAISVDVISDYAFNEPYDLLERPDFGQSFFDLVRGVGPGMWIFQQFPWLQPFALGMPAWMVERINKPVAYILKLQEECARKTLAVKAKMDAGADDGSRMTIFHQLLNPNAAKGYEVPAVDDLKEEAYSILGAAADTTGNALTMAAYYVLSNEEIYRKARNELLDAFPDEHDRLDFVKLERLPYLTAVIKEALRLSFGVPGRLPRVTPEPGATFNGYTVPAGTIVGMSSWTMHHNEAVFPDSDTFRPERWLDPAAARALEKHLVAFGKGNRMCVGMPLAYCEIYITLGTFLRKFEGLKIEDISKEDLELDDYVSSYHPLGSKKLHVRLS